MASALAGLLCLVDGLSISSGPTARVFPSRVLPAQVLPARLLAPRMAAGRRSRPGRSRGRSQKATGALEWRVYDVRLTVEPEAEGAGYGWTPQLGDAVAERIGLEVGALPAERLTVVRRSLDARPPRGATSRSVHWSYVVDVELDRVDAARLRVQSGRLVPAAPERARATSGAARAAAPASLHVVVVGAGPCGLFAALTLAQAGVRVTLCERGKPVEQRGKDVGALVNRRILNSESNFCYGEGGAGERTRAHTHAHARTRTHAHARTRTRTRVRARAPSWPYPLRPYPLRQARGATAS